MSSGSERADSGGSSGKNVDAAKWVLAQSFLSSDNRIKWGALGMALTGSTIYAGFVGVIRGVLSVGAAIDLFVGKIVETLDTQATRFFDSFDRQLGDVWAIDIDLGLFQLPFNLVIVLVAFTILALGVSHFTDG